MEKNKVIAAHQPNFMPYLGLFYKIDKCGKFIFVDDVMFSNQRGINHHRNRIKSSQGELQIRVPVIKEPNALINQVLIDNSEPWKEKLQKQLFLSYKKAAHYNEINNWLEGVLSKDYEKLADFNIDTIIDISNRMGIRCSYDISSKHHIAGQKEELVLNLTEYFGGDVYYSGTGAASYLREESFSKRGMALVFSDFQAFEYRQLWGPFMPNLSILDYLFNCGFTNPF